MLYDITADTKARILTTAVELLHERPVRQIQVSDVARQAGVTALTIYKAFGNKYELMAFAAQDMLTAQVEQVARHVDEDLAPIEILELAISDICAAGKVYPYAAAYVFVGLPMAYADDVGRDALEAVEGIRAEVRGRLRTRVQAAIDAGELSGDPSVVVEHFMISVLGYLGVMFTSGTEASPQEFAQRTIKMAQVVLD